MSAGGVANGPTNRGDNRGVGGGGCGRIQCHLGRRGARVCVGTLEVTRVTKNVGGGAHRALLCCFGRHLWSVCGRKQQRRRQRGAYARDLTWTLPMNQAQAGRDFPSACPAQDTYPESPTPTTLARNQGRLPSSCRTQLRPCVDGANAANGAVARVGFRPKRFNEVRISEARPLLNSASCSSTRTTNNLDSAGGAQQQPPITQTPSRCVRLPAMPLPDLLAQRLAPGTKGAREAHLSVS